MKECIKITLHILRTNTGLTYIIGSLRATQLAKHHAGKGTKHGMSSHTHTHTYIKGYDDNTVQV